MYGTKKRMVSYEKTKKMYKYKTKYQTSVCEDFRVAICTAHFRTWNCTDKYTSLRETKNRPALKYPIAILISSSATSHPEAIWHGEKRRTEIEILMKTVEKLCILNYIPNIIIDEEGITQSCIIPREYLP